MKIKKIKGILNYKIPEFYDVINYNIHDNVWNTYWFIDNNNLKPDLLEDMTDQLEHNDLDELG